MKEEEPQLGLEQPGRKGQAVAACRDRRSAVAGGEHTLPPRLEVRVWKDGKAWKKDGKKQPAGVCTHRRLGGEKAEGWGSTVLARCCTVLYCRS